MHLSSTPPATKAAAQTREPAARQKPADSHGHTPQCSGRGVTFSLGAGVGRAASIAGYDRQPTDPVYRPLNVYTLDPASLRAEGATAVLRVPYEPLAPGPRGCIFHVESLDDDGRPAPLDLDDPRLLLTDGLNPSPSDYRFHGQMVYAVATSVYAAFRVALGRRIAWAFDRPGEDGFTRLTLRPRVAATQANATYDRHSGEIRFGWFRNPSSGPRGRQVPGGPVFTCLSHDIIVHEVAHALVDGMRSHFLIPTGCDVLGFHEGFADAIAILQHFSYQRVVESEIRKGGSQLDNASLLFGIAQAFGLSLGNAGVLRSAGDDSPTKQAYSPELEPHAMGSVFARAMFDAFRTVYRRKIERYVRLFGGPAGGDAASWPSELVEMVAHKASTLASQFLSICVRALDYCPPVDITLGEFLRAMITADRDLVPDDPWSYREALIDAFAARGIYPEGVPHLSEDALLWRPLPRPIARVEPLGFGALRFAGDPACPADRTELERQACALGDVVARTAHLELFGLAAPGDERLLGSRVTRPCIQSIRTSRRVGPDGQIVFDLVAEVTQTRLVRDPLNGHVTEFVGGSTIILGPEGEFRYVIGKSVLNSARLERQLDYQRTSAFWEQRNGRLAPCRNLLQMAHRGRS